MFYVVRPGVYLFDEHTGLHILYVQHEFVIGQVVLKIFIKRLAVAMVN
jgi:hypothetical protein